jgi:glycosyltransferase involved in cell wall biosynthesis
MSSDKIITAFVGIYNGEKYLDSLFDQIKNQNTNDFNLLIVDNSSTDNSFKILENWPRKLSNFNLQVTRNPKNLGAGGSLNLNLHRIETPWFVTIHQDDFYKPNHISVLLELINNAENDVSGVSATMGSMSNEGKKIRSLPRSSWFASDLDKYGQFIQNLKSQSIPFPCTAFRTEIYKKTEVLIHNPSFSDTEQTLLMLCYGRFLITDTETMLYRENPISESHSLNPDEREMGAFIGLTRVFSDKRFLNLCNNLEKGEINKFLEELNSAITHRITDLKVQKLLQIILIENILNSTNYSNPEIVELLSNQYADFSSTQTLRNLGNLGNFSVVETKKENNTTIDKSNWKKRLWDKYFYSRIPIPPRAHKILTKLIYKLMFKISPNHRWNNK